MLKVFICEDNNLQRNKIETIVKNTIVIENLDMEVTLSTGKPQDVIDYLENNKVSGLYFLDIDLNEDINGIQLAERIRQYDPRGFIVFVTTHAEMSYLTFIYKVEAMDYIIKDDYSNVGGRIYQCMLNASKRYIADVDDSQKKFTLKVEDKIISVELGSIVFFETSQKMNKIMLHTFNRQIEFYAKIKEIESRLDSRFYRCHRSYLINRDNIKEINTKKRIIHMLNGEECLVSTRLIKNLI